MGVGWEKEGRRFGVTGDISYVIQGQCSRIFRQLNNRTQTKMWELPVSFVAMFMTLLQAYVRFLSVNALGHTTPPSSDFSVHPVRVVFQARRTFHCLLPLRETTESQRTPQLRTPTHNEHPWYQRMPTKIQNDHIMNGHPSRDSRHVLVNRRLTKLPHKRPA